MLMAVKNQMRVCALAVKYNIMREMLNKVTFLTNILFMMFNNATFIVQWVILLRLREDVGGYTMREVMLLWGLAASSFGLSHLLFSRVFSLPELIVNGKLDAYLVQPKKCSAQRDDLCDFRVCHRRFFVWAGADLHFLFQCETAAVVFAVHCDWGVDYDKFCAADGQSDLLVCAGGDAWQQYCGQRDYICDLPRRYFSWRIAFSAL